MNLSQRPAYHFADISLVLMNAKDNGYLRHVGFCTLVRNPYMGMRGASRESLKMSQLLSPGGRWLQVTNSNGVFPLWPLSAAFTARWEEECVCVCISPVLLRTAVLGCDASCVLD